MTSDVINELKKDSQELSPFHAQMLREAKDLMMMSRSKMSEYYTDWDLQDQVYRGLAMPDREDREQGAKGKPVKMIVPNTFAQCSQFVSFLFLMFKQNERLFELSSGPASTYGAHREDAELILARDMRFNEENRLLYQWLLDTARFGPSITECSWTRKVSHIYAPTTPAVGTISGVAIESTPDSEWHDVLKYEGNLVRNVSPYRFFPDTRHALVDFQKGEFCGSEEQYSMAELSELEAVGEVAGIDFIQPLPQDFANLRGGATRMQFEINSRYYQDFSNKTKTAPVVVSKLQRWIVPSKYKIDGDTQLGPETFPVLYHLWYANDSRLVRLEPCRWWHNEFGYTVSQFTPDMHETINLGLADLVYPLQNVISWLINTRIKDVRRNVFGRNVIDPRIIDTTTLDGEGDIYLRKGMSTPIDRAIMPLPMNNVTTGHMTDAELLGGIMKAISGVNENLTGRVNSGRRSAREIGDANSSAAGRLKTHAHVLWESGLGRLGRLMLSNQRQALTLPSFMSILGEGNIDIQTGASDIQDRFTAFKSTPEKIAMGADYFIFDSSTQSEKGSIATSLQELLSVVMANPVAIQLLDVDPKSLLDEIQLLRGAGPIQRFSMQQRMRQQPTAGGAPSPLFSAFAQ